MSLRSFARVAVLCALLPAAPLRAQATGTILGNVTDSSGGAVPGATVTATNVDTQVSRDTTTDESGQYALRLLPLGNYKVDVTLDRLQDLLADRHRARSGAQRPHRRDHRARQRRRVGVGRGRCAARRYDLGLTVAQRQSERSPESAAGQSRPLLAAQHHRRRDEQRQFELSRRPRTADDDQRLAESADRIGQLPARRRQQHGRPARHRQSRAESGSRAGIPRHHQQLRRRVRPLSRRRHRRRHQVRHEPVPRRRVRVFPRRSVEREALGAARRDVGEGSARSQPIWRGVRRAAEPGQNVLLRQLFRSSPGRDVLPEHGGRPDGARARGRFFAVCGEAAGSRHERGVPRKSDPRRPDRSGREGDTGQVHSGGEPSRKLL